MSRLIITLSTSASALTTTLMLYNLPLLITLLSPAIKWTLGENIVTTESNSSTNASNASSKLLNWEYTQLKCLRLYSGLNRFGDWFDICDSNELLSSMFVWRTRSICAPGNVLSQVQTYWLIYERPQFRGPYLLLGPSRCINDVNQYKLLATTSILMCTETSRHQLDVSVICHFPPRPWREFFPIYGHQGMDTIQHKSVSSDQSGSVSSTGSLTDLLRNSANNK
ncbi:hypothetical protein MN116_004265 [Schistosoma mekongi]|uniref:Interleukin-4 inducing immunoglobulin-binding domain-containing protein n=1 Tax=Schistosoma mekongi TaxID=38744 RepID=A0AAE1ZGC7_SCHME|nr:hypothetical protein MN116_004265 [Schistosoma mekongi]